MRVSLFFSSVALLVFAVFLYAGPPMGHSFVSNAVWRSAFADQLFAGDFYPRWLFAPSQGAGSPAFYYYGPFPFWLDAIAAKALCWGCDAERSVMLGPCLLLALSGIAFYRWARLFAGPPAALLAAALYVFLPYHFAIDLWQRQALGEVATFLWMPIVLLGLARAPASVPYAVLAAIGYAGLLYSHLPSALLFSPVMLCFAVVRYGLVAGLRLLVVPVLLGVGLAGLYLVPALTTQEYINASAWWDRPSGIYDARNWLWLDGRDAPPFAGPVLAALLVPTVLGVLIAGGLLLRRDGDGRLRIFLVVSLVYGWFLMTYPSLPLWEHVALLRKVQFPWRVGVVIDLCVATMFAVWLDSVWERRWLVGATLGVVAVVLAAYYAAHAKPMYWLLLDVKSPAAVGKARADIARGFDPPEYRPAWSVRSPADSYDREALAATLARVPEAAVVAGDGAVTILRRDLDRLSVEVRAATPVRLRFRRFYFPGWQLTAAPEAEPVAVAPGETLGLLQADVPAGTHRLTLERRPIAEARIGAMVSLLGLIATLSLLAAALLKSRKRPEPSAGRFG